MALLLKKSGITRIRPLLGGLEAWRERGYPVDSVTITEQTTTTVHISTK